MKKILVIGDVMLDKYIYGTSSRLCQEAPVPVVQYFDEGINYRLGGAGNVAMNIRALGGEVILVGIRGNDHHGNIANRIAAENDIRAQLLLRERTPTTAKVRVFANQHQVLRIDKEYTLPTSEEDTDALVSIVSGILNKENIGTIVVSDYAKGVISYRLLSCIKLWTRDKIAVFLDPKLANDAVYSQLEWAGDVVTPNHREAEGLSGKKIHDTKTLLHACECIIRKFKSSHILVTEGEHGMTLYRGTGSYVHLDTEAKEVFDVAGAGDTVIAALAHFWNCGKRLSEAAVLANKAAGIVVGKRGTATASLKELGLDR